MVVFMYDDIAMHVLNPRRGVIINHPQGDDVYAGVPKVTTCIINTIGLLNYYLFTTTHWKKYCSFKSCLGGIFKKIYLFLFFDFLIIFFFII